MHTPKQEVTDIYIRPPRFRHIAAGLILLGSMPACSEADEQERPRPDIELRDGDSSGANATSEASGDGGDQPGPHPYSCVLGTDRRVALSAPGLDAETDLDLTDGDVAITVENLGEKPLTIQLWAISTVDGGRVTGQKVTTELAASEAALLDVPVFADSSSILADLEYAASIKIRGRMLQNGKFIGGLTHLGLYAYSPAGVGPVYFNKEALTTRHASGDLLGQHVALDLGDGAVGRGVRLDPGEYHGDPDDEKE